MPKVSKGRLQQWHKSNFTPQTSRISARKVSFERTNSSHQHYHNQSCPTSPLIRPLHSNKGDETSASTDSMLPRTSNFRDMKLKLIRRPTPSISLNELAKASLVEPSSPIPTPTSSPRGSSTSTDDSLISSPWGHFVDVIPTNEEENVLPYLNQVLSASPLGSNKKKNAYAPYHHKPYEPRRSFRRKSPSTNSFLPGFILTIPDSRSSTVEVEGALERLHM